MQGMDNIAYSNGEYYIYRCSEEAGQVLKNAAVSLFSWQHPMLPEDLSFFDAEGKCFLYNVAHEQMGDIAINEAEAAILAEEIPGLFLKLEKAHANFDCYLDDAIRHQPEKLDITWFGIKKIPERIGKLKQLKHLEIFEQDVLSLPPELFTIDTLESLTILTENLEAIPREIRQLVHLKSLTICCGSYQRTPSNRQIIAAADVGLDHLPPEIAELKELEYLNISYTAIQELPPQMEGMQKLRSVVLQRNRLTHKPEFLARMPNLKQVLLEGNLFNDKDDTAPYHFDNENV